MTLTVRAIIAIVEREYALPELFRPPRTAPRSHGRKVVYWLAREALGRTWGQIGQATGRDKQTVRHGNQTLGLGAKELELYERISKEAQSDN
ncbi:hypothetical protein FACS1894186_5710 [Alphaproteobacteria bacterium]|nr:hypothetical protein FACS1894186_5710 [Alphaproteobacteria bacterium]